MKTPDDLFREIEACSRRLRVSRSRLLANAAWEYLARQGAPAEAMEAWNRVIAEAGQPGADPAAVAARKRSRAVIRATLPQRR
jgi:predicted transcriptional regulator